MRSARSGGMSPVLNLLVETRTLVQALPEEQGVALLSALLRGASPVALAAQARIDQAATRMMLDLPSRTLGRGGRTAAEEETAPLSPMSALHHLLSQGDEEAAVANAVEAAPAEKGSRTRARVRNRRRERRGRKQRQKRARRRKCACGARPLTRSSKRWIRNRCTWTCHGDENGRGWW